MITSYQDGKFALKILLVSVFILSLVGYSLFQVHKIITGPTIKLSLPHDALITGSNNQLQLKGIAANVAFISLNDNPIFIDETGAFSESLLLNPGYNIIKLYGKDKFGKTLTKLVEITYKP
jgi:hypothetical protein